MSHFLASGPFRVYFVFGQKRIILFCVIISCFFSLISKTMDKTWMYSNRLSKEYENGVSEFVKFDVAHAKDLNQMTSPCLYCCYGNQVDAVQLASHLIWYGIDRSYTCWNMLGEKINRNVESGDNRTYASND